MNKTTYYINGNAVRELDEAAPVRRPQKSTRELEEIRRKKNRRASARRNQERALSMNRAFVAFLTACVAASSPCICFTYSDKVKCDTADEGGCST